MHVKIIGIVASLTPEPLNNGLCRMTESDGTRNPGNLFGLDALPVDFGLDRHCH